MRLTSFVTKHIVFLCLNFVVISCGSDSDPHNKIPVSPEGSDFLVDDSQDSDEDLTFLSDQEKQYGSSSNQEKIAYLVGFKSKNPKNFNFGSSYIREYNLFMDSNTHLINQFPEIIERRHLTALRLKNGQPDFEIVDRSYSFLNIKPVLNAENDELLVIDRLEFDSEENAKSVLRNLKKQNLILYAEPDYQVSYEEFLKANPFDGLSNTYTAINTSWMQGIRLDKAFDALSKNTAAAFDEAPVIAVMDTGTDYSHSQLKSQIWENDSPGASGCDNDFYGCNTAAASAGSLGNGDIFPFATNGPGESCPLIGGECDKSCCHGTHVAGIIAAQSTSGSKIAGVCPTCKIMTIRLMSKGANGEATIDDSAIIGGLKYISRFVNKNGDGLVVRVVNASFGKFQRSKTINLLIRALSESGRGTLLIGAAGNEDTTKMQYPAAYKDSIAVAALAASESANANASNVWVRIKRSNYGRWVDIAAPGESIISTVPGNNATESKSGTSMATPIVAGVAGLILSMNPSISYRELRSTIINSADSTIYDNQTNASYYARIKGESAPVPLLGSGIVSAENAVQGTSAANLPVAKPLDRVNPGCGSIHSSTTTSLRSYASIALLQILLILFMIRVYQLKV